MNVELITAVMESPTEDAIEALLGDEENVFWVDWREKDDEIPETCEMILQTGALSGELVEVETGEGYEVHIHYQKKSVKVPLTYSEQDRHITICTLNDVLKPDFEIRYCIDSNGNDSAAFLPLA